MNTQQQQIEFKRIKNDINGNPRYVCHFLRLLKKEEIYINKTQSEGIEAACTDLEEQYKLALTKARKLGGRKFHNKQYGGGIVFQSYNIKELEKDINELITLV